MSRPALSFALAIFLSAAVRLPAEPPSCPALAAPLAAAAKALPQAEDKGGEAFAAFRKATAEAARAAGMADAAARLAALAPGKPVAEGDSGLASCVLRAYVRARYGERIVRDLQAMLGFRTFAQEGKDNWDAPEFLRQRQWLSGKAAALGLDFKDYDGRVDEITLPGPQTVLALLVHGDVEDVAGQTWSSPPFEGRRVGERIVGRGTEDDKGPAIAALYTLAALKDSGWPLSATVRLVIANGEESSWDEIPYYLARASMPDMTVGLDAAYPVTHAQKGYGVLTFRPGKPQAAPRPGRFRVVKITGGSGVSIIPERGEALLAPAASGSTPEAATAELSRRAAEWAKRHPPANLVVSREGEQAKLVAVGKGGHSSEPRSGHNALGDLSAFLASLDLTFDPPGALVAFVGAALGTETDGQSLGLARHDAEMGDLTANLSLFKEEKGEMPAISAISAVVNIRAPRGLPQPEIERRLAERTALFARRTGVPLAVQVEISSEPHLAPVDGKVVAGLLAVWKEVTGAPGRPIAVGGGTEARLFPGGVDFGPATSMEHYRGHGTDEFMTVDELLRVAELTTAAVWKLAGPGVTP
jgi:predicted dipeptidase